MLCLYSFMCFIWHVACFINKEFVLFLYKLLKCLGEARWKHFRHWWATSFFSYHESNDHKLWHTGFGGYLGPYESGHIAFHRHPGLLGICRQQNGTVPDGGGKHLRIFYDHVCRSVFGICVGLYSVFAFIQVTPGFISGGLKDCVWCSKLRCHPWYLIVIVLGLLGLCLIWSRYKAALFIAYLSSMYWAYTLYQSYLL